MKPKLTTLTIKPNAEVVAKLKDWLRRAESGKLQTVMLVGDLMGNETLYGSAGDINVPAAVWSLKIIERHIMTRWDEGSENIYYEDE